MKSRKAVDLRSLSTQELQGFLKESEDNVTRLRFQLTLGQLQDSSSIKTLRKDIARMKTLLHERTSNAN
ncbi:MAG: 50S ribosomal protein L29 [Ignavibacteria bacterium]|nr:50S ribosomal protein L29 [Ignavibacteria bacterium]MBP6509040.1 50S ribosomal protein L29 [Candidatus Kapabacteria bacterium]MBK6419395.1 50S ribosomal protein L29 [Ignavibacteria bacterium]MBK6759974.1 50S ribosomal protein L29 [Ignavibacteria bacterium]MBK7032828.1 50S ribosomal protein L29 [Ignavibacteria bacterium]